MRAGPAWTNRSQTVFMQLTYQKLKPFALSYLTAPLAVFFAGYLRAPFASCGPGRAGLCLVVCRVQKRRRLSKWGKKEQGITLSVPKLVLLFALMLLWGYLGGQTGFFLPELGLGLPQRHLPGSDHKQLAGVLPAKGYGAGVLYRALAGPGGADQTGIRPVWAGCRLDVRPYGPLGWTRWAPIWRR